MKIGKNIIMFTRAFRVRAPPGHGGAVRCFFLKYQSLIRRGGAPPWAAATVIIGGMGVSTPLFSLKEADFQRKPSLSGSLLKENTG
jgi:hypothetical protein